MKLTWKEHPDLSGPSRRGRLGRCEVRALFLPLSSPAAGSRLAPRNGSDRRWSRAKGSRSVQEAWDCRNRACATLFLQPMLLMLKNSHPKRHLSWLDLLTLRMGCLNGRLVPALHFPHFTIQSRILELFDPWYSRTELVLLLWQFNYFFNGSLWPYVILQNASFPQPPFLCSLVTQTILWKF